jgi:hypothetical protein
MAHHIYNTGPAVSRRGADFVSYFLPPRQAADVTT